MSDDPNEGKSFFSEGEEDLERDRQTKKAGSEGNANPDEEYYQEIGRQSNPPNKSNDPEPAGSGKQPFNEGGMDEDEE